MAGTKRAATQETKGVWWMTSLRPGKSFRSLYDDLVDPLLRGCVFFCSKRRTLLTVCRYEYSKISHENNWLPPVNDDGTAAPPRVS